MLNISWNLFQPDLEMNEIRVGGWQFIPCIATVREEY